MEGERWTHCKDPVPSLEDGLVLIGRVVLSHQVGTLILEGVDNCVCVGEGNTRLRSATRLGKIPSMALQVPQRNYMYSMQLNTIQTIVFTGHSVSCHSHSAEV